MSKKIAIGALSVATALSTFAILGTSAFAAQAGWHKVSVAPESELVLTGSVSSATLLEPSITTPATAAAGALTIQANEDWKLQWMAVTGDNVAASTTAADGTNLGTAGFTDTGGYAYAGSQVAATTGDTWGAVIAVGTGAALATTPTLDVTLSDVATGGTTAGATVTPTYSASTTGTLGQDTYFGTIYYSLVADI